MSGAPQIVRVAQRVLSQSHVTPFLLSSSSPTLKSILKATAISALVAAAACGTEGVEDKATFAFGGFGSLSAPLAVGATQSISTTVPSGTVVDHATSSDPTVVALGAVSSGGGTSYDVQVTALKPGSVTLTIYDASNHEIDQATVQVASVASLQLAAPSGVAVLQGGTFDLAATAVGAGNLMLEGFGEIHFAFGGSLVGTSTPAPTVLGTCTGNCVSFQADAIGDGQVEVTAATASASFVAHVVPVTAIDSIAFATTALEIASSGFAASFYTLRAGGATLFTGGTVLTCTSSNESVATELDLAEPLGPSGSSGMIGVSGVAPGVATIVCSANGQQATVDVLVK